MNKQKMEDYKFLFEKALERNKEVMEQVYFHYIAYGITPHVEVVWCEDKNDVEIRIKSKYVGFGLNCKENK